MIDFDLIHCSDCGKELDLLPNVSKCARDNGYLCDFCAMTHVDPTLFGGCAECLMFRRVA